MKIALFLPDLRGGGAERVMLNLAQGIANKGHEVDLVLVKAEGALIGEVPEKVQIIDLNAKGTLRSMRGLRSYLARTRPDALISAMAHANVVALMAERFAGSGTKVIVSVHSTLSVQVKEAGKKFKIISVLTKRLYPEADAIVCVSKGVAEDLTAFTGIKRFRVTTIYNPVVTPRVRELALEKPNHPFFAAGQPPVVLSVGRLGKEKDFPTLVRAFNMARAQVQCKLLILGEGSERHALEKLRDELNLRGEFELPGHVPNPFAAMANCGCYVLSSTREGLPGALIEAMASGAPLVSTDCPSGPNEILQGGKLGKLTPVGDVRAMADAIVETLQEPKKPPKESVRPYSLETAVDAYLDLVKRGSAR